MHRYALLVHLVGMAIALGGVVAAIAIERLDARKAEAEIARKLVLSGVFLTVGAGVVFAVESPAIFKLGFMHPKLLLVLVALVASHVDAIGMKRLVRAAESEGAGAPAEALQRQLARARAARRVTALSLLGAVILGALRPF